MGSSFEVHGEQMLKALDLAGTNGLIRTPVAVKLVVA
jgi:hypothetical protein